MATTEGVAKRSPAPHDLCAYPSITYDTEFAFHKNIMRTFHAAKLKPDILLSASDAEIIKNGDPQTAVFSQA